MPPETASTPLPRDLPAPAGVLSALGYLGGLATLGAAALGSLVRPAGRGPRLVPAVTRRLDELFALGLPLVGLTHVGFGSFLSMQAYFGATFTQANGAVVGLGLIRNVAPMMTGFVLAGLMAVKVTSDLGGEVRPGLDDEGEGHGDGPRTPADPARRTLVRVLAVAIAGPMLVAWGAAVGIGVGALVSRSMLGLPYGTYFNLMLQMLRPADVTGVLVKGVAYPGVATLIACHEALRPRAGAPSAFRAMVLSILAILTLNFSWFNLVYLSGGVPFGPPVLDASR